MTATPNKSSALLPRERELFHSSLYCHQSSRSQDGCAVLRRLTEVQVSLAGPSWLIYGPRLPVVSEVVYFAARCYLVQVCTFTRYTVTSNRSLSPLVIVVSAVANQTVCLLLSLLQNTVKVGCRGFSSSPDPSPCQEMSFIMDYGNRWPVTVPFLSCG